MLNSEQVRSLATIFRVHLELLRMLNHTLTAEGLTLCPFSREVLYSVWYAKKVSLAFYTAFFSKSAGGSAAAQTGEIAVVSRPISGHPEGAITFS